MIDPPDAPTPDALLIRDPLTGAYARGLLDRRLLEELHRARRYGEQFALCVLDIDYFKSVNDAYGHLRGDQILRELAQRLLGLVRAADALFRYGGDEFVLLLPNTPPAQAVALAERLLQATRRLPFGGQPPLTLSLSIGIAHFPADGDDIDTLFAGADARHYEAKRQGRSRVIAAPGKSAPAADGQSAQPAAPPGPERPPPDAGPSIQGEPPTPGALPAPPAALIGRERELRQIEGLLQKSRLVTLLGAAGIGKTRLAVEIGRRLGDEYEHGTCFVALGPISDPALAEPAIAAALGLAESPAQPLVGQLKARLAGKAMLLILDHFDQLVAGAALVTALLSAAPRLNVLVTSSEVLRVYGEHVFPLPPLALPPEPPPANPGALADQPAVALFVERAQAASPGFGLDAANAAGICRLCHLLDGLPLALELAAGYPRSVGEPALLHLAERIAAGQQPLAAVIAWSAALLSEDERRLWTRLGVFVGGGPAAAVQPVCAPEAGDELMVRSVLQSLADKNLLVAALAGGPGGQPRIELAEPLRAYALGQLAAGELAAARRRHAAWVAALAEAAAPALRGPERRRWLAALDADYPNLRAALEWALAADEDELALRTAGALARFWHARGQESEGRGWLEAALERSAGAATVSAARARALSAAGFLAEQQGDDSAALERYQASLELWQALGDANGSAGALVDLARLAYQQADLARAESLLAAGRPLDDRAGAADYLGLSGLVALQRGSHADARRLLGQSLELRRALDDQPGQAETLESIAGALADSTSATRAVRLFAAAAALRERCGAPPPPAQRQKIDRALTMLRAHLSDETWKSAWDAGCALPREQAVAEALDRGDTDR